jgi:hypothetical protein
MMLQADPVDGHRSRFGVRSGFNLRVQPGVRIAENVFSQTESPQMKIFGQHFHELPQIDLRHVVHHHVYHSGGGCDWYGRGNAR